jgi:RNA polymerase sigma factor (sigma-70 family)
MASWTTQIRKLKQLLRHRGQSPEDAEDLVQEAFLRLQAFLNKGHEVQRPEGFLVRTALNLAVDASRRAKRERRNQFELQSIEDLPLVDLNPSPEEMFSAERRLVQIRQVLDSKVSVQTREVFFLHRLEGFTHEEIAARLGINVRAVETHIARAVTTIWLERSKE